MSRSLELLVNLRGEDGVVTVKVTGIMSDDVLITLSRQPNQKRIGELPFSAELDGIDGRQIEERYQQLETRVIKVLARQGIVNEVITTSRVAELRYVGQTYEVPVDAPADLSGFDAVHDLIIAFHAEHESLYGVSDAASPVAIVNLRVTATGRTDQPAGLGAPPPGTTARSASRMAYFEELGYIQAPVYRRADITLDAELQGPAIIEQRGSSCILAQGWLLTVDSRSNLILTRTTT